MTPTPFSVYNIRMQNTNTDTRKLNCQVNVRMTFDMREQLEARAHEQWTSASQIARMAVARELDRQLGGDLPRPVEPELEKDES